MTWYELFLFVHITASIVWIGAGFLLLVLGLTAQARGDQVALEQIHKDNEMLAPRLFVPASLTVLVAGILLMIDGSWKLDQLWIVLGLIGYAATFVTGLFLIKPQSDRIAAVIDRDGFTPTAAAETRRLLALARIDYSVFLVVVADMVIKPTGDDVGVLIAMAVVIAAVTAFAISRARAITAPQAA